jgi:cyclase
MLKTRVIPCLLIKESKLYKTINFKNPSYIGDPINAIKIFNDKEVDELMILDIGASKEKKEPNYELIKQVASECFMPLAYGGGITSVAQVKKILEIGVEKVSINNSILNNPSFLSNISKEFGAQSIIASIDLKKNILGKYSIFDWVNGKTKSGNPLDYALKLQDAGAGELLITNVNKEGTWDGFDIDLIKQFTEKLNIPIIANGGAENLKDIENVVINGQASAVGLGSMVVYQKKGFGVLINFPDRKILEQILN